VLLYVGLARVQHSPLPDHFGGAFGHPRSVGGSAKREGRGLGVEKDRLLGLGDHFDSFAPRRPGTFGFCGGYSLPALSGTIRCCGAGVSLAVLSGAVRALRLSHYGDRGYASGRRKGTKAHPIHALRGVREDRCGLYPVGTGWLGHGGRTRQLPFVRRRYSHLQPHLHP